jgi:hypothetical protein
MIPLPISATVKTLSLIEHHDSAKSQEKWHVMAAQSWMQKVAHSAFNSLLMSHNNRTENSEPSDERVSWTRRDYFSLSISLSLSLSVFDDSEPSSEESRWHPPVTVWWNHQSQWDYREIVKTLFQSHPTNQGWRDSDIEVSAVVFWMGQSCLDRDDNHSKIIPRAEWWIGSWQCGFRLLSKAALFHIIPGDTRLLATELKMQASFLSKKFNSWKDLLDLFLRFCQGYNQCLSIFSRFWLWNTLGNDLYCELSAAKSGESREQTSLRITSCAESCAVMSEMIYSNAFAFVFQTPFSFFFSHCFNEMSFD